MPERFGTIHAVTQLELENFGAAFAEAEEADEGKALTFAEIQERELAARATLKDKLQGDDLPSWTMRYHQLLQSGWKWRIAAYAAWASTPKEGRWPRTQDGLAKEVLGLTSDRVIGIWHKRYPMLQQVIFDLSADELMDARADAFATLKFMATQRDYKNAKYLQMYLEMIGAYVPTTKLAAELKRRGITSDDLADLPDDELRALAGSIKQQLTQDNPSASDDPDAMELRDDTTPE